MSCMVQANLPSAVMTMLAASTHEPASDQSLKLQIDMSGNALEAEVVVHADQPGAESDA